jgi:hypothetical protein
MQWVNGDILRKLPRRISGYSHGCRSKFRIDRVGESTDERVDRRPLLGMRRPTVRVLQWGKGSPRGEAKEPLEMQDGR